jgi:hypothetical protein
MTTDTVNLKEVARALFAASWESSVGDGAYDSPEQKALADSAKATYRLVFGTRFDPYNQADVDLAWENIPEAMRPSVVRVGAGYLAGSERERFIWVAERKQQNM